MGRTKTSKRQKTEASEVFRQFAWNIAGTLAKQPPKGREQREAKT